MHIKEREYALTVDSQQVQAHTIPLQPLGSLGLLRLGLALGLRLLLLCPRARFLRR